MKSTQWTAKQARDALKIPAKNQKIHRLNLRQNHYA